ncbi:Mitotic spindle assembly checkpoint protein MAD2B [Vanrija pseudolonga]|uniref:Mitotic spindle assembly checkpoint protein MAD2B n=1 Tax=Vanrija pseudolonga TaxID=143232 RepID=A0AAF1BH76_9TREE|nr:Mitotic spindle assembly checkpoint protein MAD2B [Vanrija pseudolonga]
MPPNARAGPSRLPDRVEPQGPLGISFKETVDTLASFLEVVIHTILCIRQVYPPTTFTRRRAHGVAVYQSRHPAVRDYVSKVVAAIRDEMDKGTARRVTVVIKTTTTGLPLERFIIDVGYMPLEGMEGPGREAKIMNAPTSEDLSLRLRAFLIRLAALDGQLLDNPDDTTWAIIVETNDNVEPGAAEGAQTPWVPALAADTLATNSAITPHHEPLLSVRAVETGVIDLRMMVQECAAKTGVDHLDI